MLGDPEARSTRCREGEEFDGRSRIFRATWSDRWEAGEPYPPLAPPVTPGRWNENQQPTVYTSHEPAVALREKLEHLDPETWAGSLLAASGQPLRASIVVIGFEPLDVQTYDGRTEQHPDIAFGPLLGLDYAPGQLFSLGRRALGDASLVVPSAPLFRDGGGLRWNRVFFIGGRNQPKPDELPGPSGMSVECESPLSELLPTT